MEKPSPFTPNYNALVKGALNDVRSWLERLSKAVWNFIGQGKRLPVTGEAQNGLTKLLNRFEIELRIRFAGQLSSPEETAQALKTPGIDPTWAKPGGSWLDLTVNNAKREANRLDFHPEPEDETPAELRARLRNVKAEALEHPLTQRERLSSEYIRQRGEVYMTDPARRATTAVRAALLTEEQRMPIRMATAEAVKNRLSPNEVKQAIWGALQGNPGLQNDLDRVVRTEMAWANAQGAGLELQQRHIDAGGDGNPMVVVMTSPNACEACKRIWGPRDNPTEYRLEEVMTASNFRKPKSQWGPALPVHPNCTCTGPIMTSPKIKTAVRNAMAKIEAKYGKGA